MSITARKIMTNKLVNVLLSFSGPLLVTISLLGLLQRDGNQKLQILPALVIGFGLIISGSLGRYFRRKKLFLSIRKTTNEMF